MIFVACFGNIPRLLLFFFLSELTRPLISSLGDDGVEGRLLSDSSIVIEVLGVEVFNGKVNCCGDDG